MPQWGKQDATGNSVLWAPTSVRLAPNTDNRDAMYGNSTADAFTTGQTVGMYGVDKTEIKVGSLGLATVTANGVGTGGSYVPGEHLTLATTGATSVTAADIIVSTTKIRTVAANASAVSAGYANGDTVSCNTGTMTTNAVFTVTTGLADTKIASLALTANGVFTVNPTLLDSALKNIAVVNASANGGKAAFTMRLDSLGVFSKGNYSVVPTEANNNTLSGSVTGTGATAAVTWSTTNKGITHTGWVLRTEGSGGRAGRVQNEVLVAGGIAGDGTDDTVYPDA